MRLDPQRCAWRELGVVGLLALAVTRDVAGSSARALDARVTLAGAAGG